MEAISTGTFDTETFVKGKGAWLYDKQNKAYFDGTSGSGAVSLGHQHPYVTRAIISQAGKLSHTGCKLGSDIREKLAQKIVSMCHYQDGAALFTVTGSEAVEAALKVARAYTGRKTIVHCKYAYHGKTSGSLSLTWRESFKKYSNLKNNNYLSIDLPDADANDEEQKSHIKNINEQFTKLSLKNDCPAAIVIEPIRVTEGLLSLNKQFLEDLINTAHAFNCIVIFDEIYIGLGRCGQLFYADHLIAKPDLILIGKTLGNGMPISLIVGEKKIINSLPNGIQTSTYSGNPICCAAAYASLEVIEKERLWEKAQVLETEFYEFLSKAARKYKFMSNIRAHGALFSFTCVTHDGNPFPVLASQFKKNALDKGLILFSGGFNESIVKLAPPVLMTLREKSQFKYLIKETLRSINVIISDIENGI
ncbi:class-III pyridoxal-phosphate-dependent aminotransferase [Flavobacterium salmonis]|uniref:Aspartate aminotransferase family protein n=1 Tax=Flavobacterium salmonis TaxID=2654844 RepID=A0A6V6Z6Y4_9FLAO|nr:aspartate aminotransferase family protein [Flavobacterium salmonis]CAD0007369.1 aspartate aminotransferase family protein [Flavobacterium salmonis]